MFLTRRFLVPIDSNSVFFSFFSYYESHAAAVRLPVLFPVYSFVLLRSTAEGNSYRLGKTTVFFVCFFFLGELFVESSPILLPLPFVSIM